MTLSQLPAGRVFDQAPAAEVAAFLQGRSLRFHTVMPERLRLSPAGRDLILEITNGGVHQYPVRQAFLLKLLKWFAFPVRLLDRVGVDTVACVGNDFLLGIDSGDVTVLVEDGEALGLTSGRYNRLEDLAILRLCSRHRIEKISRNDRFTRMYTELRETVEVRKGDDCGFGLNIVNSETGFRALAVYHYVLRLVCTNGAVMRAAVADDRITHYGWPEGELERWLEARVASGAAGAGKILPRLRSAGTQAWQSVPPGLTARLRRALGVTGARHVLRNLSAAGSRYEAFNALTHDAKTLDLNGRFDVELAAGDLAMRSAGPLR